MRTDQGRLMSLVLSIAGVTLPAGGCANRGMVAPDTTTVVLCSITRQECIAESLGPTGPQCDTFQATTPTPLVATACAASASQATMDAACAFFCTHDANRNANYGYPSDCKATGAAVTASTVPNSTSLPVVGVCHPLPKATNKALVGYGIHQNNCDEGEGNVCSSITDASLLSPKPPANCVDLSTAGAFDSIKPGLPPGVTGQVRDGVVDIFQVVANSSDCAVAASALIAYDLTPGPLGQATAAGTTVPFSMTRGFATINNTNNQLNDLSINIANLVVSGAQLSNVIVTNTFPAPLKFGDPDNPSHTGIAAGNLKLRVQGLVAGVPQIYNLQNDTDLDLIISNTTFKLSGTFNFTDVDQSGKPLPVSVAVTAPGTPSTAATKACATASPIDRLFGFEDPQSWSSTVASLSLVTSPLKQGCGALGIQGQGFMPINSVPFASAGLALKPALSVDLFIPGNQPNQFYLGALQMYLTCPSVNAFNEYIGQVELTGKPQNAYSTLRFPLPSQVTNTLKQGASDCSWTFTLNANPTNRTWILDNLRFTN
jgi:hypothetical protein